MIDYPALAREVQAKWEAACAAYLTSGNAKLPCPKVGDFLLPALRTVAEQQREQDAQIAERFQSTWVVPSKIVSTIVAAIRAGAAPAKEQEE